MLVIAMVVVCGQSNGTALLSFVRESRRSPADALKTAGGPSLFVVSTFWPLTKIVDAKEEQDAFPELVQTIEFRCSCSLSFSWMFLLKQFSIFLSFKIVGIMAFGHFSTQFSRPDGSRLPRWILHLLRTQGNKRHASLNFLLPQFLRTRLDNKLGSSCVLTIYKQ